MPRQQKNIWRSRQPGFSLVDIVMSFFVISILVLVFANLLTVRTVNRRLLFRTQAAAIANEELSVLKRYDISSLPNQTNGPFLGMLYNAGAWTVATDPSSGHSGTSVLDLAKGTGFSNRISGRLQFPAGSYDDATWQAAINFSSDTAAGTATGFFFRASDADNGYRLLVAPTGTDLDGGASDQHNWLLEKVVNGSVVTPRILATSVAGITINSWHTMKVVAAGSSLKTYLDGNGVDSGALVDTDFVDGAAALVGWNGVHVHVDDVSTTVGLATSTWNFEGSTSLPTAWVRLGLNDLPNSTPTIFDDNGTVSISPYPNTNSTTLKQATIAVSWNSGNGTDSYSITALIGSSHIGQ